MNRRTVHPDVLCPHHGDVLDPDGRGWRCPKGHGWSSSAVIDTGAPEVDHAFRGWKAWLYNLTMPYVTLPLLFGADSDLLAEVHAEAAWGAGSTGVLLDAPCGTGLFTSKVVASVGCVVGADLSPTMLAGARRRMPNAVLTRANLEQLPLGHGAVDAVVCSLGLQFLADRLPALTEFRRVLAPGGVFVGVAPSLGLFPAYDRRHATRKIPDHPVAEDALEAELHGLGFSSVTFARRGALLRWRAT